MAGCAPVPVRGVGVRSAGGRVPVPCHAVCQLLLGRGASPRAPSLEGCCARRWDSGCRARYLLGAAGAVRAWSERGRSERSPSLAGRGAAGSLEFLAEVLEMFGRLTRSCYTLTAATTVVFASAAGIDDGVRTLKYADYEKLFKVN